MRAVEGDRAQDFGRWIYKDYFLRNPGNLHDFNRYDSRGSLQS